MNLYYGLQTGVRVKTAFKLASGVPKKLLASKEEIAARKPDMAGKIEYPVVGHGIDVWTVKHDDGTVGAYHTKEFNLI